MYQKSLFFWFWSQIKTEKIPVFALLHQPFTFYGQFWTWFLTIWDLKSSKIVKNVKGNAKTDDFRKSSKIRQSSTCRKCRFFGVFRRFSFFRRKIGLLYSLFWRKYVKNAYFREKRQKRESRARVFDDSKIVFKKVKGWRKNDDFWRFLKKR